MVRFRLGTLGIFVSVYALKKKPHKTHLDVLNMDVCNDLFCPSLASLPSPSSPSPGSIRCPPNAFFMANFVCLCLRPQPFVALLHQRQARFRSASLFAALGAHRHDTASALSPGRQARDRRVCFREFHTLVLRKQQKDEMTERNVYLCDTFFRLPLHIGVAKLGK